MEGPNLNTFEDVGGKKEEVKIKFERYIGWKHVDKQLFNAIHSMSLRRLLG